MRSSACADSAGTQRPAYSTPDSAAGSRKSKAHPGSDCCHAPGRARVPAARFPASRCHAYSARDRSHGSSLASSVADRFLRGSRPARRRACRRAERVSFSLTWLSISGSSTWRRSGFRMCSRYSSALARTSLFDRPHADVGVVERVSGDEQGPSAGRSARAPAPSPVAAPR